VVELGVEREFSAAHQLRGYQGACEKIHGHNWKVLLEVRVGALDKLGLGLDFTFMKSELDRILASYDHVLLNNLPEFQHENPTSENLARHVFEKCRQVFQPSGPNVSVIGVTVWESSTAFARYAE
jgi:6-pyruvoyltetrahydropterin/6-carboxytetrahydropterin synthase